jgi:hypothetical protein
VATATQPIPVAWDSLQNTKPWQALTDQQQRWCIAFIAYGGDPVKATALSYNCASPKNAVSLSYEIRRHKNVITFLDLYRVLTQGAPSREEQIAGALEMIREVPAYEQVKARRLLAQLTGFVREDDDLEPKVSQPVEASPARCKVGDIVLVEDVKYRVTGVDETGKPTDGEPL